MLWTRFPNRPPQHVRLIVFLVGVEFFDLYQVSELLATRRSSTKVTSPTALVRTIPHLVIIPPHPVPSRHSALSIYPAQK
jgi:hypothetical protein